MSELPAGWAKASLADLGTWCGGGTPSKSRSEFWTNGTIPWVSPKDMKAFLIADAEDHITEAAVSASATNVVPVGSVLAVTRSGILRRTFPVAVTTSAVAINQDLKALRPTDEIDPKYIAWYLRRDEQSILHDCSKDGTTVDSIDFPALLKRQLPIAPHEEQKRIVAAIEEQFSRLDAGVAVLERVQHNLRLMRAAVLDRPFTPMPLSEWEPLSSIGSIVTGTTPSTADPGNYGGKLPFVTPSDFDHGDRIISAGRSLSDTGAKNVRAVLPVGSVLATCIGATLGKVALADVPCAVNQQINAIIPDKRILSEYLFYCLARPSFTKLMWKESSSTTMPILNKSRFSALRIPVVSIPKQEQIIKEISERMSFIERLSTEVAPIEVMARKMRSAILLAAFSGRLVPQDPSDEPASAFLERLAAQRVSSGYKRIRNPRIRATA